MAKKASYDERSICAHLKATKGSAIRFSKSGVINRIDVDKTATIGIHTWGKIDFLVNHCGYSQGWFTSKVVKDETEKKKKKTKDKNKVAKMKKDK